MEDIWISFKTVKLDNGSYQGYIIMENNKDESILGPFQSKEMGYSLVDNLCEDLNLKLEDKKSLKRRITISKLKEVLTEAEKTLLCKLAIPLFRIARELEHNDRLELSTLVKSIKFMAKSYLPNSKSGDNKIDDVFYNKSIPHGET